MSHTITTTSIVGSNDLVQEKGGRNIRGRLGMRTLYNEWLMVHTHKDRLFTSSVWTDEFLTCLPRYLFHRYFDQ